MSRLFDIGPLRLDPQAGVLSEDGVPVALGARGVAVLTALVSRAPECVAKADILEAAWPGLVVEEANLAVQISSVRRALARVPGSEGWIETLARRGYRFVGPVTVHEGPGADPTVLADRTRTNLPQVLSSFVGRSREIAEIKRLLPTTRALTLVGTGGIGKTRLALQAAAEVIDAYRDGVWFVDLAALADPALVVSTVAQVLGLKEAAGQPLQVTLCEYARTKEMLLVLDNCEHMLGACADLVDALLRAASRVCVVATSREPLRIAGEHVYPLSPLPLPAGRADVRAIARSEAVQLFVDRARQHRARFDLDGSRAGTVAAICRRLDGLPLALELAAARVAMLPVDEILRLLDQRFRLLTRASGSEMPRQQTLRAMIDWSYDLLDEAEKQLFARLSVFAGGWTLAAAEAVGAGDPIAKDDVAYLLVALIDKSLVAVDENGDRYRMLETVREYAREKLAHSGEIDPLRSRHRDYFLALAEEADPRLDSPEQAKWLRQLEEEYENLRAGLAWSLTDPEVARGLRTCGSLWRFWYTRGHFSEGRSWCNRFLEMSGSTKRTLERAHVLNAAGVLAFFQGDYGVARTHHEECLSIRRELHDWKGIAASLQNLGNLADTAGDWPAARELLEESLAISRRCADDGGVSASISSLGNVARKRGELGCARELFKQSLAIERERRNLQGVGITLDQLGMVGLLEGDFVAANAFLEESLAIRRELHDKRGIASALHHLGEVAGAQGDCGTARRLLEDSLAISRELGNRWTVAAVLHSLASLASEQGETAAAEAMCEESLAIGRELENRSLIISNLRTLGVIAMLRGDPRSALSLNDRSLLIARDLGDRPGIAVALEEMAALVGALGDPVRATRLWGAAERIRQEIGTPIRPNERVRYERALAQTRASVDDETFHRAWLEGRALSDEQAMELALAQTAMTQTTA
jgi:non-specific serine/threonine protein kinase